MFHVYRRQHFIARRYTFYYTDNVVTYPLPQTADESTPRLVPAALGQMIVSRRQRASWYVHASSSKMATIHI
jgi:hypothetical protein